MPANAEHVKLMRVTIREDFSIAMTDMVGARWRRGGEQRGTLGRERGCLRAFVRASACACVLACMLARLLARLLACVFAA